MQCSRVLGAVALLCTLSSPVYAQGWIDPRRPVPQDLNGRVERLRSAVQVSITGRVARVTVEEWFRNNGPALEEGVYHFPLPGEAVFSSYSLWQGDQELRGEAMDAAQARSIYEAIVRQKRDPALIELAGQGLIRARVFPIGPGETRKITLKYTQLLDRAGDAWRFRYLGDRNRQTAPRSFRLEVDSAARFGDPYSPTHQVQLTRRDDRLEVTLGAGVDRSDDRYAPRRRSVDSQPRSRGRDEHRRRTRRSVRPGASRTVLGGGRVPHRRSGQHRRDRPRADRRERRARPRQVPGLFIRRRRRCEYLPTRPAHRAGAGHHRVHPPRREHRAGRRYAGRQGRQSGPHRCDDYRRLGYRAV